MKNLIIIKLALSVLLFSIISINTIAQKLPKIQQASLRAPLNIKIDGAINEWGNKFQAYNNNTDIFYTIANDDDKLYLVIQATDQLIIRKIFAGNITFAIKPIGEKNDEKAAAITYPLFSRKNWPNINLKDRPVVTKDSTISSKQVDSFMNAANIELSMRAKEIKMSGIKALEDTLSIYNEEGIRAVSLFDHHLFYNYELAIPLKYLGLSVNNKSKFSYNIKLDGSDFAEGAIIEDIEGGTRISSDGKSMPSMDDMRYMRASTHFSGVYTLVGK